MPLEHPETNFGVTGTVRECRNIPQIIHKSHTMVFAAQNQTL